jgi:hypothetical protein
MRFSTLHNALPSQFPSVRKFAAGAGEHGQFFHYTAPRQFITLNAHMFACNHHSRVFSFAIRAFSLVLPRSQPCIFPSFHRRHFKSQRAQRAKLCTTLSSHGKKSADAFYFTLYGSCKSSSCFRQMNC